MSKLLVKDKQRIEKILEVIDGSYELGMFKMCSDYIGGVNAWCGSPALRAISNWFPYVVSDFCEVENQVHIKFYLELKTNLGTIKELIHAIDMPKDIFELVE
jgi:hypothetical protein